MSLQYRRYGERHFRAGAGLYLTTGASLAAAPLTALADRGGRRRGPAARRRAARIVGVNERDATCGR